jgi:hypothetical protein
VKLVFGLDALYTAVAHDLASRYCPTDKTVFLERSGIAFAALAGIALLLFSFARSRTQTARRKELGYIGACAIAVFAVGSAALVAYGLSGCGGETQAGLTWEWPW